MHSHCGSEMSKGKVCAEKLVGQPENQLGDIGGCLGGPEGNSTGDINGMVGRAQISSKIDQEVTNCAFSNSHTNLEPVSLVLRKVSKGVF